MEEWSRGAPKTKDIHVSTYIICVSDTYISILLHHKSSREDVQFQANNYLQCCCITNDLSGLPVPVCGRGRVM